MSRCPDCGSSDWAGIRCYGEGHATESPRYVPGRCECCGGPAPRGQLCGECRSELQ